MALGGEAVASIAGAVQSQTSSRMNPAAVRVGALWAMGGVGVVTATWAFFFPPAHPQMLFSSKGTPLGTPAKGLRPSALPSVALGVASL